MCIRDRHHAPHFDLPAELKEADEQKQVEGGDEDDQAAVESEIKWHDTTPFWANARNFFYPIIF